MTYTAHLEWLCEHVGLVRVGRNGWQYGEPYDWMTVVVKIGTTVEVVGCDKTPTLGIVKAVKRCLIAHGYSKGVWTKMAGARPGEHEINRG